MGTKGSIGSRLWVALLLTGAALQAQAVTFTVDNAGSQDDGDALAPGNDDSVCDINPNAGGAHCTLRAAIQEANDTPGSDTIVFASGITTITLTIGLPTATTPMVIDGLNASAVGQRVDINGGNTNGGFDFNASAQGSTLKNLVIRNFNDHGVAITGHGYTIDNNFIGITPNGLSASKNTGDGINVTGVAGPPANIPTLGLPGDLVNIATITADLIAAFSSIPPNYITTNIVSGNDGDGIEVFSENAAVNIISNNRVGTNAAGLLAIPNGTGGGGGHGVRINSFAYANVVGPGNLISGNNSDPTSHGVALTVGAVRYPNFVAGNIIGPSNAIVTGLGNSGNGVFVDTSPQTTTAPTNPTNYAAFIGPGNIIGYNGDAGNVADPDQINSNSGGIQITGASARVRVLGNFIGVGEDPLNNGTFVNIGNHGDGINISTSDHEIGGFTPPEANVISSNKRHGVSVRLSGTHSIKITGNIIGRDPLNLVDQSNDADGVRVFDASGIQIGGTGMGEGNVIAGNTRHGIKLGSQSSGSSNLIARNAIFGNGDLGIDLDRLVNDPDPIPDPLDPDPNPAYANDGQNQPLICDGTNVPACAKPSYNEGSGATSFNWRLTSAPSTEYVFEVYASDAPDTSGWGEGQTYIGTFNATTDGSGNAQGNPSLTPNPALDTRGKYLTMTVRPINLIDPPGPLASGPANNSSEFSNAVKVPVPGTLQFSLANYAVAENAATATITVTRVGGADGDVGVNYATSNGSAAAPADYASASNTLSWADGDMASKSFDISIVDDGTDENNETVNLALSAPTGGATLGMPSSAVLTINDDDLEPQLAINDVAMAEGQSGTTVFTFTVTLTPASGKAVSVNAASADNSATLANNDYQQLMSTPVNFAVGETSKPVLVNVNGDGTSEGNESFFVNLAGAVNAAVGDAQGVGTIIDDEAPIVTVTDANVAEGNAGPTMLTFTVSRSDATGTASVDVQTADGTAMVADGDYVGQGPVTVNFGAGVASVPVNVVVNGDLKFEGNETVLLNLSNGVNVSIGDNQALGIINNDDAQPTIAINNVSQAEGQAGSSAFTFTASLSNPSDQAITVMAASADGSATLANNDYQQLMPSLVTFNPGVTSQPILVNVNGDMTTEGDEQFLVELSGATNATILDAQGIGTILDDEAPVFTINDVAINEGNAGTTQLSFTLTRTPGDGASSVTVASADGSATLADGDYLQLPATVVDFLDGETSKPVVVSVNGDTRFEADQNVLLNLSAPVNASIGDAQGVGTINNDDSAPAISIADVSLAEGQAGTTNFAFTLSLSNASDQSVTVMAESADNSATLANNDYQQLMPVQVTFDPGMTQQNVNVLVNGDADIEGDESFFVNLSGAGNGSIADAQAIGTIIDDEGPVFSINDVSLAEGNAGTSQLNFTITRSLTAGIASVDMQTANGSASAGSDYVALAPTTVVFADGEATRPVQVTINGDTMFEGDETLFVNLSNAVNASIGDGQGMGAIINDDSQPTISIADLSLAEGNAGMTPFVFQLSLSNGSDQTITVSAASADGSATLANNDYQQLLPTVVTFDPGVTTQTVSVQVVGDTAIELAENFVVNLGAANNAGIADNQATGTIGGDDVAITSYTGPSVTGSGSFTGSFSGGGFACTYVPVNTGLIGAPPGAAPVPSTLPVPGVVFVHGLFRSSISGCTPGATLAFTYTYASPLPPGTEFWKYGRTLPDNTPHWYQIPVSIVGNTVSFSITDGGLGDDDLMVNGSITDPAGPAVPLAALQNNIPIPATSRPQLLLMLLAIAAVGMLTLRRRLPRA